MPTSFLDQVSLFLVVTDLNVLFVPSQQCGSLNLLSSARILGTEGDEEVRYSLGLDIGSESVGWSVVELDGDDQPIRLVRVGVRTFDVVRNEETRATTPAQERRLARSQRRRLRNRHRRIRRLGALLQETGLVASSLDLREFLITRPGDPSPWKLRVEGLERRLEPQEWTRVLYHIVRHRGFKAVKRIEQDSTRSDQDKQRIGAMLAGMRDIHRGLTESGHRTVAEFLESPEWLYGSQRRNKHGTYLCTIGRDDLIEEARVLFDLQRDFGNPFSTADMEERYVQILDEPPSLVEGDELQKRVGSCFLEPDEKRAPKACLTMQHFVILQTLVNQRLVSTDPASPGRRLTASEIETLLEEATKIEKLTYKRALKTLGLGEEWLFSVRGRRRGKTLAEAQSELELTPFRGHCHALDNEVSTRNGKDPTTISKGVQRPDRGLGPSWSHSGPARG